MSNESRLDNAREAYSEFFAAFSEQARSRSPKANARLAAAKATVLIHSNVKVANVLADLDPRPCQDDKFAELVNEMRDHVGTNSILPQSVLVALCGSEQDAEADTESSQ